MSNFDPLFSLELIVAVIVTDEEIDVTELLWVVVTWTCFVKHLLSWV